MVGMGVAEGAKRVAADGVDTEEDNELTAFP